MDLAVYARSSFSVTFVLQRGRLFFPLSSHFCHVKILWNNVAILSSAYRLQPPCWLLAKLPCVKSATCWMSGVDPSLHWSWHWFVLLAWLAVWCTCIWSIEMAFFDSCCCGNAVAPASLVQNQLLFCVVNWSRFYTFFIHWCHPLFVRESWSIFPKSNLHTGLMFFTSSIFLLTVVKVSYKGWAGCECVKNIDQILLIRKLLCWIKF